jgi:hypothetical protein
MRSYLLDDCRLGLALPQRSGDQPGIAAVIQYHHLVPGLEPPGQIDILAGLVSPALLIAPLPICTLVLLLVFKTMVLPASLPLPVTFMVS